MNKERINLANEPFGPTNGEYYRQTCPTFGFCMKEPYFDELVGYYAVEVQLVGFENLNASGINLSIDYDDNDIEINEENEEKTEESLLSSIKEGCNGNFSFNTGSIILGGIQPPLDQGPVLTTESEITIFIIYFSLAPGGCVDFTFDQTVLYVSFPLLEVWDDCIGDVDFECEIDNYCIPSFSVGGTIESPVLDCDDSANGGIIAIAVEIEESNNIPFFNCATETDTYGDYECLLTEGLDYRITPVHDFNRTCGLSSLDIDIYMDHLLGSDCIQDVWTFLSGDVDQNEILNVNDLVDIQKAILEIDGVEWESWTFVPASEYNGMSVPNCVNMDYNVIPPYDPYIDIEELDDDYTNLDFVGIKMGDANGTCTVCSQDFTSSEEILSRNAPQAVELTKNNQQEYALSFPTDILGLEVLMLAFTCNEEPRIKSTTLQNSLNFITLFRDGVFYISYASSSDKGDIVLQDQPFIILEGNLAGAKTTGPRVLNEMIVDNELSVIELRSKSKQISEVFPNPTNGEISIVLDDWNSDDIANISIYNLQGTKLFDQDLKQKVSTLNLRLQSGVYHYILKSKSHFRSSKIIIH